MESFFAKKDHTKLYWIALFMCLAVWLGLKVITGDPISEADQQQPSARTGTILFSEDSTGIQTIVPERNGFHKIQLQVIKHTNESADDGLLTLELFQGDDLIATDSFTTKSLSHSQKIQLQFDPQSNSKEQPYTLKISGEKNEKVALWGTSIADQYSVGEYVDEDGIVQDLRFTTYYQLSISEAIKTVATLLKSHGTMWLLATAILFMPAGLWVHRERDPFAWLGLNIIVGMAIWPILWVWVTTFNGRWTSEILITVVTIGWLGIFLRWLLSLRKRHTRQKFIWHWHHLVLLGLLLLALSVHLLSARELVYPSWVDAGRHGLMSTVMSNSGQLLQSYEPYLPVGQSRYHFGYHTIASTIHLVLDIPIPTIMLWFGQWMQLLIPLSIYTAVIRITGRRGTAILSAFLATIAFIFPGYYMNWGRYTQLAGMIVLPLAIAEAWRINLGDRGYRPMIRLSLLLGGLFIIHIRVFLLFVPFILILWIFAKFRGTVRYLFTAVMTTYLILPRLIELITGVNLEKVTGGATGYNDLPTQYLSLGMERPLWIISAVCGALSLILYFVFKKSREWTFKTVVLSGWIGLMFLLLAGKSIGLPESWVVNLNSMVITLFLPMSLIIAFTISFLWDFIRTKNILVGIPILLLIGIGGGELLFNGVRQQIDILNSATIMVHEPDLAAITWMDENLPENAHIAVSSWRWMDSTYSAEDAGMWIPTLIQRSTTTPPADYMYDATLSQLVNTYNAQAKEITDWRTPESVEFLQSYGVTHIYIGAKSKKNKQFSVEDFYQNEQIEPLYGRDGAFVFAIK